MGIPDMRKQMVLEIDADSEDLKEIKEMQEHIRRLEYFSKNYDIKKFIAKEAGVKNGLRIMIRFDSEEAEKHVERLMKLAKEMEKETKAFYRAFNLEISSPAGKMTGLIL